MAEWVGLDNSGTDLYQSGTDSECYFIFGWTFTNYWMWIEIFVADQNGQTWFRDNEEGNGGLTPADNSVWFMPYNNTNGSSLWGTYPTAPVTVNGTSSTGYTGSTAEFILGTTPGERRPRSFGIIRLRHHGELLVGDSEYGYRPFRLGPAGSSPFDATLT